MHPSCLLARMGTLHARVDAVVAVLLTILPYVRLYAVLKAPAGGAALTPLATPTSDNGHTQPPRYGTRFSTGVTPEDAMGPTRIRLKLLDACDQ
jgi:hypothetical protein